MNERVRTIELAGTRRTHRRRGNAIVLVAAVLALLAIVAFSYVIRTQAERATADAVQRASLRDDSASVIAADIADMIGRALFAQPLHPFASTPGVVVDSNQPRIPIPPDAVPYDRDRTVDASGAFIYPYNFAPYTVFPHTNWPDKFPLYPAGPNNLALGDIPGVFNAWGNPGFNDTRWLASFEPERYITNYGADGLPPAE